MKHNEFDVVPTPEEYADCPLTRYLFETQEGCETTLEWLKKIDVDTLTMIVDSADSINKIACLEEEQNNCNEYGVNQENAWQEDYNDEEEDDDEDWDNPFNIEWVNNANAEYTQNAQNEIDTEIEIAEKSVNDYVLLAGTLCSMELDDETSTSAMISIPEEILTDAIQFLSLWAIFEKLRRKGLVNIVGTGLLTNHGETYFNLTEKGRIVSKYIRMKNGEAMNDSAHQLLCTLEEITLTNTTGTATMFDITSTTTTSLNRKPKRTDV